MSRVLSNIKGTPPIYTTTIDYFRGVDVTSAPINVAQGRSFNAPNMIRDVPGKVRKRMGYQQVTQFPGQINGIFSYNDHMIIHAGERLYTRNGAEITNAAGARVLLPNRRSMAYRLADKLAIVTGAGLYVYWETDGGNTRCCDAAANQATVPQVTIGRPPNGSGGESLEQINMLTPKYTDSFLTTGAERQFQLSFYPITQYVEVYVMTSEGVWTDVTSNIDGINRQTGVITLTTAPSAPPVSGEDNVRITARCPDIDKSDELGKCRFGIVAGVKSAYDRLFISGNPDMPNTDWFSNSGDPLFFGDWNYGEIGKKDSPITGYSIVEGTLATHKKNDDDGRNCYLRVGEYDTDRDTVDLMAAKFPITGTIQGKGCIAPYSMGYAGEPLYLTAEGVFATTPYEFNGRLYTQRRSFYLDGQLLSERNLQDAVSVAWRDYYLLAINGTVYILDTLQRDSSDMSRGSQYQYEGYIWTGIPVRCWFAGDRLWFGDELGCLYRFYDDKYSSDSYTDNGEPIIAQWDFMHFGANYYMDKTLIWIAMNLDSTPSATVDIFARRSVDLNWQKLVIDANLSFFSYSALAYGTMAYGGSDVPKTVGKRIAVKRYDSATISLRNDDPSEGIFIYAITLQFYEGEKYKL